MSSVVITCTMFENTVVSKNATRICLCICLPLSGLYNYLMLHIFFSSTFQMMFLISRQSSYNRNDENWNFYLSDEGFSNEPYILQNINSLVNSKCFSLNSQGCWNWRHRDSRRMQTNLKDGSFQCVESDKRRWIQEKFQEILKMHPMKFQH